MTSHILHIVTNAASAPCPNAHLDKITAATNTHLDNITATATINAHP